MEEIIEIIVDEIIAEKREKKVYPVCATLKEIRQSAKMEELIKGVMRKIAIAGKYKAGLSLDKTPMLIEK